MAIVAECAVCGKRFKAAESQAGKKAKCSQCGTVFVIGAGAPESGSKVGALAPPKTVAAREAAAASSTVHPQTTVAAPTKVIATPASKPPAVAPARVVAPTKVTASRAASAPVESQIAPQMKPAPEMFDDAKNISEPATSPLPVASVDSPIKRGRGGKWIAAILVLALVGGAAVVVVPKLLNKAGAQNQITKDTNPGPAQPASYSISPALAQSGPAWTTTLDTPAPTLKLPDDFHLVIPAQPPLRHNPGSMVLAPAPSPFLAITLLPSADRSQPTIEVWNLYTKSKTAQFKLNQPLTNPMLSQDGGYYAGQFYDQDSRSTRVEVWSTSTSTRLHTVDIPSSAPIAARAALGFPLEDQIAIVGDKLQVWNLTGKSVVREIEMPSRSEDTRAAASAKLKLVAVADSKLLTLVDLSQPKVIGRTMIPEALVAHPRHRLSLHAIEFSPDGKELALLFDNRQSTRRIGVFDVATGTLKALHTPSASVQSGGPDFQWTADSQAFLVGAGVLLDRPAGRQIGQIFAEVRDEGLGGMLSALLADDRALAVWDKYPTSLVLRSVPVQREKSEWININIASAAAARYEQLQCVSREFGNLSPTQSLYQWGRLTDGSQFLVVDTKFTASLSPDAPMIVSLRPDRFVLVADGQAKLPIGSIGRDGNFSLEKPESDLRKGDADSRTRSIVYAVSGKEKSLALQIGSAVMPVEVPAAVASKPMPSLSGAAWEQLSSSLFSDPDDSALVSVRVTAAHVRPYELEPEAAEHVPLRITYSPMSGGSLMAVTFDMTVNTARSFSRNSSPQGPRLGLLLPDGKNIRPVIELPDLLPITLGAGERRTHTCLFIFSSQSPRFRLTYDGVPVATIAPEGSTAQSVP